MRVVMLLYSSFSGDARVTREAAALVSAGHSVTILCLRADGLPEAEEIEGFRVQRVADGASFGWRRPIRKIADYRSRVSDFVSAALAFDPQVVHCHDTDTLSMGFRIAKRTRARLVYDAHELFLDMLIGHGVGVTAVGYWRGVERSLVPRCDAVISANAERAVVLRERYGVRPVVVRNVPPAAEIVRTGRLRRELGLRQDGFVFLYQGVLNPERALDVLVDVVASIPGVYLVLQGAGSIQADLAARIESANVADRVFMTGWVDQSDLHEYACDADCGIVIYEATSLNNSLAAPNKLWSYMMAGLPVVSSDFPGLRAVVVGEGIGDVFDPSDADSLKRTLVQMASDPKRARKMGARGRALAQTEYNWEREAKQLTELYENLDVKRS